MLAYARLRPEEIMGVDRFVDILWMPSKWTMTVQANKSSSAGNLPSVSVNTAGEASTENGFVAE
ncbi:hypothetical protein Bwad001_20860 [Bilophila wadsworthia]